MQAVLSYLLRLSGMHERVSAMRDLDITEETDREGRRVFCAKFDQNPKWGRRHNATSPRSIYADELLTWPDDGAVSQSYFANDRKYFVDEDEALTKTAIEDN
ncbi:protocatechuate -dioxygenase subunit beta [Lasius niger]|uniref:Protocatechuate-dioxygenase subunit beta n=1 Tax=Lasius niger TaxID=67767 RepID=A0A0J7KQD8_LASNI|nr:protocatechuate -dioxygenase subunit beta [Lasius niger]